MTRTSSPGGVDADVEPDLLDFADLFFEDSLEGKARPLAEYLKRFPRAEAAIAREWLRLMGADEDAEVSDPTEESEDDRVGHYRLLKELGRGGQGAVWLAQDTRIARKAAIKFMPQGFGLISEEKKGRFRREAEVIARLEHPGLCRIYDADVDADSPWIAMRLVEGEALSARIGRAHTEDEDSRSKEILPVMPQTKAELHCMLRFFERAARALHAAHEVGVIHRDIKPGNLMITPEGEPVLLDFGMARGDDLGLQELTASGDIFGTPSYMSPEQVRGASDEIDKRADVWALGVTLQEALTIERPFGGQGTGEILSSVLTGVPRKPSERNSLVTEELDVVVATALERDLDRRYPSAIEFAEELRRICEYEPIHARPASPLLKLTRWARRHPALAASITISFLSLSAGLITTTWLRAKEQVALDHALGRHLAERSRVHLPSDPNRALRLGIDGMELSPHEFTRSAVVAAMATSRLHATLSAHPKKQFRDLDISPAGDLAVMALTGATARIFDLDENIMLFELNDHEDDLIMTQFASDADQIVTVSKDGHVIRWDREGGLLEEQRLELALASAVVCGDGTHLGVVTEAGEAYVCQSGDGEPQRLAVESVVQEVQFMNSDELVITRDEAGVFRSFAMESGELVFERELEAPVVVMAGELAGENVAFGSTDGEIQVWDLGDQTLIGRLSHGEDLTGLRYSSGSDFLVSWGGRKGREGNGTIHVWSTKSLEKISTVEAETTFLDVLFDPAGNRVAACRGTHEVDLFDLYDGAHLESLSNTWIHKGLRWSQDGTRLAALTSIGFAPVWYMEQRQGAPNAYSRLGVPSKLLGAGDRAFVLHENGALASWRMASGRVAPIDVGVIDSVRGLTDGMTPGQVLVWGDGGLGVFDAGNLEPSWTLETAQPIVFARGDEESGVGLDALGHAFWWKGAETLTDLGPAMCVAISPGREWVATAGEGTKVQLRATSSGVAVRSLSFESASRRPVVITDLMFRPDGAVLVANTSEKRLRFFEVATGEEVAISKGILLREVEYTRDGRQILGLPGDRHFARILDSTTGLVLTDSRTHHDGDVQTADIDAEAQFVVMGSNDGMIQVWQVADGKAFLFHEHEGAPITDVIFRGRGEGLGVLAASKDGSLWGVPVHPLNSVYEHEPEPLGSWVANKETESAKPFTYLPPRKFSGIPGEG